MNSKTRSLDAADGKTERERTIDADSKTKIEMADRGNVIGDRVIRDSISYSSGIYHHRNEKSEYVQGNRRYFDDRESWSQREENRNGDDREGTGVRRERSWWKGVSGSTLLTSNVGPSDETSGGSERWRENKLDWGKWNNAGGLRDIIWDLTVGDIQNDPNINALIDNGGALLQVTFGALDVAGGVVLMLGTAGAGILPGVGLAAVGVDQISSGLGKLFGKNVPSVLEFLGAEAARQQGFTDAQANIIGSLTPAILSLGFGGFGKFGLRMTGSIGAANSNKFVSAGTAGAMFGSAKSLTSVQKSLLGRLATSGSETIVAKRAVSMNDLRNLTLYTGDEFAMLTRRGERLIFRGIGGAEGTLPSIPSLTVDRARILAAQGWRFSGHTHTPGFQPLGSPGDKNVLRAFGQRQSAVWGAEWGSGPGRFFGHLSDEINFRMGLFR